MKLKPTDILTNETLILLLGEQADITPRLEVLLTKAAQRIQEQEEMIDELMKSLEDDYAAS